VTNTVLGVDDVDAAKASVWWRRKLEMKIRFIKNVDERFEELMKGMVVDLMIR